jgi:23S rRNA (cytidine1920-2'-O)/16S rRNA (cytidine1409-2'-O)-methyltransferase
MTQRLDQLLLDLNLVETRSKARGLIIDGKVIVDNEKVTKPGTPINPEKSKIQIINNEKVFVSRAGAKLFKAVTNWKLNLENLVCLDIGSSTGGFTQCCLEFNAKKVFALDVGTNQLDWKLRSDSRVVSMEKTNFRYVTKENFNFEKINFYCCDVSFISLSKILPALNLITNENSFGVMLIKPQFESEREDIVKGKAKDLDKHADVIKKVFGYVTENNFSVCKLDFSPILGNKKKNIEYLMLIKKESEIKNYISDDEIKNTIELAKSFFSGEMDE